MRRRVLHSLFVHSIMIRISSAFRPTIIRSSSKLFLRAATTTTSDRAVSRPPFRMPEHSSNDSSKSSAWSSLGLWTELTDTLQNEMKLEAPTAVQQLVLPQLLLDQPNNHVAFLAATGSGQLLLFETDRRIFNLHTIMI